MDPQQVVRIFATTQSPDYENPWQTASPRASTGSGVVIGPGRVLTGAHVVADATFLQAQTVLVPDKVVATVEAVCHDCDLALLSVEDPEFAAGVAPAAVGELPSRRDRVSVVGFPVGGEEVSITEGVVSRIEVQNYSHSQRDLLAVTIDAAINEGNSGGPVYGEDGAVVGIAFQALDEAENVGEMVPAPLIRRFLQGVDEGRPTDVPGFGMSIQTLENPTLRKHLRLPSRASGLLVNRVEFGGSAHGVIEPGDVLSALDGLRIANNGTIEPMPNFRTRIEVVLGERYLGDGVPVKLHRDGAPVETELEMCPAAWLVPRSRYDVKPRYFVFGGLVFQPLTRNFLETWDDWREYAPRELSSLYYLGHKTAERQERIILSQVFADELTIGYDQHYWSTVDTVCGTVPRDLEHLVELVESATDTLEVVLSAGERLLLDVAAAREAHPRILTRYQVPRDRALIAE